MFSKFELEKQEYKQNISSNVLESEKQVYEFALLRQVGQLMQRTFNTQKLLHIILTCVTAGGALGFNRALLFLVNNTTNCLEGKMGVGPSSLEEAHMIWDQVAAENKTLEDYFNDYGDALIEEQIPFYWLAREIKFDLNNDSEITVKAIKEKRIYHIVNAKEDPSVSENFLNLLGSDEFITVPLVAKDKAIGVIVADNLYSRHPITQSNLRLLSLFANQAGLAIENSRTYSELKKEKENLETAYKELHEAKDKLIRSEQLATIGNMAAHVAHEIRNPLCTIGGFAIRLLRDSSLEDKNKKSVNIIVEEVARLEKILKNMLDFMRPDNLVRVEFDLFKLMENTLNLLEEEIKFKKIVIEKKYEKDIKAFIDAEQLKQVFINILRNAIFYSKEKSVIWIEINKFDNFFIIKVQDFGVGINENTLKHIFNPFFTTRNGGIGLGLAISRKIMEDHGGYIKVNSKSNEGAEFFLYIPCM